MSTQSKVTAFIILSLFLLQSCQNKNRDLVENAPLLTTTFEDDLGRKISFEQTPQKVISLAPSITEMLFAIGANNKVIAISQACNYPPEALNVTKITTYPEIDYPALVMLESDLVLATDEIISGNYASVFERLHMKIFYQRYRGIQDIYTHCLALGKMLEVDLEAQTLVDSLQIVDKKITEATQPLPKYSTMILVSVDPLIVIGGTGYIHEMIEKAGGENAFSSEKQNYVAVTPETVLKKNPEIVVIPGNNEDDYGRLIVQYPALANITAVTNKQVYSMNPDLIFRPGPRTLEGTAMLANILHSSINPSSFFEAQ